MTLNKKERFTLKQELDIIHYYMTIQQLRFDNRLNFTEAFRMLVWMHRFPSFPFSRCWKCRTLCTGADHGECIINLTCVYSQGLMQIYVKNSGSEFPDDLLENLRTHKIQEQGLGIALLNIEERIQLMFGQQYGLHFYNENDFAVVKMRYLMLKMIIVDDEKIIRETIHSLIDWNSLGIDVAAVCKDGIEAFDCILDEYPDIVMTDIKMPGLSGLDLIEKVRAAQLNTEFIILSGYGEFEFARTAMRYGVKHYLLKPSNETEITQVIVSCVETCKSKTASRVDSLLTQLFLTEMPPEKLLQRRFFTELSGEQDVDLAKTQMIRLVMEASKKEYYPLSKLQTTDSLMAVNVCVTMNDLIPSAEQIMTSIFSVEPQHKYTDCVKRS